MVGCWRKFCILNPLKHLLQYSTWLIFRIKLTFEKLYKKWMKAVRELSKNTVMFLFTIFRNNSVDHYSMRHCLRFFKRFIWIMCIITCFCWTRVLFFPCSSFCFFDNFLQRAVCTGNRTDRWNVGLCGRFRGIFPKRKGCKFQDQNVWDSWDFCRSAFIH